MNADYWLGWPELACLGALGLLAGAIHRRTRRAAKGRARAQAAAAVAAMARANAQRMMEWLISVDRVRAAQVAAKIDANNRVIDAALGVLEQSLDLPGDRARLADMQEARLEYLASLERMGRLIEQGQCLASSALLIETGLPAMGRLVASVHALSEREPAAARPALAPLGAIGIKTE